MQWLTSNVWWIRLLVEIGIFAGVTWLVYINKFYYNQSLRAMNEQIKLKDGEIAILERTQIDNFVVKWEAQKKIFNEMEKGYVRKINEIKASKAEKDQLIFELKTMVDKLEKTAETATMEASGYFSAFGRGLGMMGHVGALSPNPHQGGMAQILSKAKEKK